MNIDQETHKDKTIRDPNLIASFKKSRKSYEAEADQVTTPNEIKLLQNEVFQLKHFGQSLHIF